MASILLAPAEAAKGFVDSAIKTSRTAESAGSGYGVSIASAVVALTSASASVTAIQTVLIPLGATTPPAKIGVNITGAILAKIIAVPAAILATTTQSTIVSGGPSLTFPSLAKGVTEQLEDISDSIQKGLVEPQQ